MSKDSLATDFTGVIAVVAHLIGTATGNAYIMLGISTTALLVFALFCRKQLSTGAILVALLAAITSCVLGFFALLF